MTILHDKPVSLHLGEISETVLVNLRSISPEIIAVVVICLEIGGIVQTIVMMAVALLKQSPSPQVEVTASLPRELDTTLAADDSPQFLLVRSGDGRIFVGICSLHAVCTCTHVIDGVQDSRVNLVELNLALGIHQENICIADDNLRIVIVQTGPPFFLCTFP